MAPLPKGGPTSRLYLDPNSLPQLQPGAGTVQHLVPLVWSQSWWQVWGWGREFFSTWADRDVDFILYPGWHRVRVVTLAQGGYKDHVAPVTISCPFLPLHAGWGRAAGLLWLLLPKPQSAVSFHVAEESLKSKGPPGNASPSSVESHQGREAGSHLQGLLRVGWL